MMCPHKVLLKLWGELLIKGMKRMTQRKIVFKLKYKLITKVK